MSATSAAAASGTAMVTATPTSPLGSAQQAQGTTAIALATAVGTAFGIFAAQMGIFELLRNRLTRIYRPKTYLVPERERTRPPAWGPLAWVRSIFTYRDREIIAKCGLDAYFFLRYLQTLLIIFIPLGCLLLPVLLPINYHGGRRTNYVNMNASSGTRYNVTGLDTLAWGNVAPTNTDRYWAHLIMAIVVVAWVCTVFFFELRVYIRVRQDFLTSAEHRLTASATTILVSAIPKKWLSYEALDGLYDVFPGGIRNIWINRNFDALLSKINNRKKVRDKLEAAETELVKKCKKAQVEKALKEEKIAAKKSGVKKPTKEEKQQRAQYQDEEANRRAQADGVSAGDPHEVRHTVEDAVEDSESKPREYDPEAGAQITTSSPQPGGIFKLPVVGGGLAAVRHGLNKGFGAVGNQFERAGKTIVGGARAIGDLDDELDATPGFVPMDRPPVPRKDTSYQPDPSGLRVVTASNDNEGPWDDKETAPSRQHVPQREVTFGESPAMSSPGHNQISHDRAASETSLHPNQSKDGIGNEPPKKKKIESDSDNWLHFWRGPAVGYPSPKPHGYEEDSFPFDRNATQFDGSDPETTTPSEPKGSTIFTKIKNAIPGLREPKKDVVETYPEAYNEELAEDGPAEPLWKSYIKESDRPRHKLPLFSWTPGFLPSIPFVGKKVDTIYWCRKELARLNLEIREDQNDKDNEIRYPLMNSAFIQFNHQVAAHMACQSVSHHIPKQMAPRQVEIAPSDVIWDNMSIRWWEAWARTFFILCIVSGMVILWAFPVAGTALLGNLPLLIKRVPWLHFLNDDAVIRKVINALSGVLPALGLAVLLALVPPIFYALAKLQGAKTLPMQELSVQNYYFFFLFVQVFLVVSIASGALDTLSSSIEDVTSIPQTLAENLPKASDYFFSYMILQAFGNSSGALLQYMTLILWFVLPKIIDSTARQKFNRATSLSKVSWGTYFPVYTNFACIALVYSVIAPLILVFAVITFSLYWIANRYCMLYIFKLHTDTGGLLYPRAINQTFTGLYIMEICMVGLFFIAQDEKGHVACIPQAIIMIVVVGLTVLFQYLLNDSFGPLFNHLPITLEDDAVLRDEQFERIEMERIEQEERGEDEQSDDGDSTRGSQKDNIEMRQLSQTATNPDDRPRRNRFDPLKGINSAKTWATRGTKQVANNVLDADAIRERHRRRQKDLEKQQQELSGTFFSGHDELEDLSPHQRDALVKEAFRHIALRETQPAVWIPRDDLGVSDDEILRTTQFSSNIWLSNTGAGLDSKQRVIFQRNPPDFSEIEHIRL